jgi:hypothetical protein
MTFRYIVYTVGLGNLKHESIDKVNLNSDLEMILLWSIENSMVLNASKTQGMIMSRNNQLAREITPYYSVRNSGLSVDCSLCI